MAPSPYAVVIVMAARVERGPRSPQWARSVLLEPRGRGGRGMWNGDLSNWASQEGVLLLNSVLTIPEPDANGWGRLITDVFCRLRQQEHAENIFWVFWGKKSWGLIPCGLHQDQLLKTYHPNYPNSRRLDPQFFGSKPFSKINSFFEQRNLAPIEWQVPA